MIAAGFTVALLTMITDACDYTQCGNPEWINGAIIVGLGGGIATLAASVIYVLHRHRTAWRVALLGCVAQCILLAAAIVMEMQAGPL